ncbi:MAG: nucleotidyl transferase AbiEii/AbiGii toxin family protein [Bacilli bacterium]|nr:nucleotidyl transferase AbiEii/AbiGii toxin family protein [Bacilli bacterium]
MDTRVQTFVGEYLQNNGQNDLVQQFDLGSFPLKTQTLERTFVDKVFAICDYSISLKLDRQSRHIYDLRQILPLISLDEKLVSLFHEVREYRTPLPTCYSAQPGTKLHRLLSKLIGESTFESDYQSKTYPLLYDQVRYESCVPSLLRIQKFLEDSDL